MLGFHPSLPRYFPNGAIRQFTYGNGLVHTLTQNARQLPDTSCDFYGSCGAGAALNDGYDYDLHGNVLAISDGTTGGRGNRNMTYDGLDRLKTVASPMYGTIGANYSYDVLDNLTRVNIGGTAMRDHYYCYDAQWRLTNVKTGGCNGTSVIGLGYDAQGNLANKNGQQYQFDFGNRLREAVGQERYRYDGHGRRAQATTAAGSIFSQYSQAGQLLYQEDERIAKDSVYVYLGGSLVATLKLWSGGYAVEYQHTDALGSPVAVTDANRVVIEKSEYEPYGGLLNRPIKDGPGYTGHVSDAATGLSYMQQRYYDSMLAGGRFLSVDPVTATNVGGNFNRYWYANNNPYKFTDPDGRRSREDRQSEERESRRERKENRDRARNSDVVITRQGSKNPVSTIVSAQGLAADAGAIATNRAAHGLAQYGWQAGEDAAMWKGMSRTLGRFGSATNFATGGYELTFGESLDEQAHGAVNVGTGLLVLGGVVAPEVGIAYGLVDLAVGQAEYKATYTTTFGTAGQTYTGWRGAAAARGDHAADYYTSGDFSSDGVR